MCSIAAPESTVGMQPATHPRGAPDEPADLVIRHARLVCGVTTHGSRAANIAVAAGALRTLGIGGHGRALHWRRPPLSMPLAATWRRASWMAIWRESAMVGLGTPAPWCRAAVGIYWDPHGAMNVAGLPVEGAHPRLERRAAQCMITPGSCVPAVPGLRGTPVPG